MSLASLAPSVPLGCDETFDHGGWSTQSRRSRQPPPALTEFFTGRW